MGPGAAAAVSGENDAVGFCFGYFDVAFLFLASDDGLPYMAGLHHLTECQLQDPSPMLVAGRQGWGRSLGLSGGRICGAGSPA